METPNASTRTSASSRFRLQAKNLFLTWPQCEAAKEDVLQKIKEKWSTTLEFAVVSKEEHADGSPHLHAAIALKQKYRCRDSSDLDSLANSHGNYQSARSMRNTVKYVTKDGDFIAHGVNVSTYLDAAKTKKSTKASVIATQIMEGVEIRQLLQEDPGYVMANLQKIQKFQLLVRSLGQAPTITWAKLNLPPSLSPALLKLGNWMNSNLNQTRRLRQKQLLLSSPPGLGKTTLVEKLINYFHVYPHVGGKWFDGFDDATHDLIVFDEFVGGVPMTVMNKVLDGQRCTLEIKGASIWKIRKQPVMILTNKTYDNLYTGEKVDEVVRQAFFDRVEYVRLEQGDNPWKLLPYFNGALESAETMPDDEDPSQPPSPSPASPPPSLDFSTCLSPAPMVTGESDWDPSATSFQVDWNTIPDYQ